MYDGIWGNPGGVVRRNEMIGLFYDTIESILDIRGEHLPFAVKHKIAKKLLKKAENAGMAPPERIPKDGETIIRYTDSARYIRRWEEE